MGFFKRFLSLGSSKSKKNKKKQNAVHSNDVDAEGRMITQAKRDRQDPDTSANRLLRSCSTKFSVVSEVDYSSLPPPPLPFSGAPSTPSLSPSPSMLTIATTPGVQRSGTYVVKVHGRTTHSRTEFPRANPPPSPTKRPVATEPETPQQDGHDDEHDLDEDRPHQPRLREVNFTPKDNSRIYALRQDPSVVSLLNMYDDNGCLDVHAFASASPTVAPTSTELDGHQPRQRTGSTLRQLLGEPQPTFMTNTHVSEGDISWAERFLDEQLNDDSLPSSPASETLETPKDTLFPDDLSAPRVVAADTTLSSLDTDSSNNYPAISSMEVEVSETVDDVAPEVAPTPKPVMEPKTPQRASEVFGFLHRRNTVNAKERELPEIPHDLSPQSTGASQDDGDNNDTSLNEIPDAIHSANTSNSASNISSDTPSNFSHGQIQTATMTKLTSAFAASTLSLNLLVSGEEAAPTLVSPTQIDAVDQDQLRLHSETDEAVPATSSVVQSPAPEMRQLHTGSTTSTHGSSAILPPSRIPRGPRPRPMSTCRRDGLTTPVGTQTPETTNVTEQRVPPSDRTREALTNIPQRQHSRVTSRASNTTSERDQESAHSPQPALRKSTTRSPSYTRKRPTNPQRLAQPFGKENTPSPPRASPKVPSPSGHGGAGLGFATPMCARSLAGHLLEREKLQEPPSPALSTELSPITQGMMQDLRKQRMRARQAERRRGIWVRDRE